MTRPTDTVRWARLTANIESRRRSPELRRLIRHHKPDVVHIQQAYRARLWLIMIAAALGYKHRQYWGTEAKGIAVLVRRGVRIKRRRALRMTKHWTGSKAGKRHKPRVYPALTLEKAGVEFRELGIHLPTHNERDAQRESLTRVARYFRNHPDGPLGATGDWNMTADELEPFAENIGAVLLSANAKVDHSLARGVTATTARRLPMPPGVHGWSLFTVEATKEIR